MDIIIYGSEHGTTKRYAEELARQTGFELASYEAVGDINAYDTIIYLGSLYAGGVKGMQKTFSRLADPSGKKIIIATVGLADPTDAENTANIKTSVKRQLKPEVFAQAHVVHLRGGIDYSQLSLKHKAMMALLVRKARGLPEEQKNAEVRAMIETYGKQVDFVDLSTLDQITALL